MGVIPHPANTVGTKRIRRIGSVACADILVIVESSLLVIANPEVQVTQQHIDGEIEELGVRIADITIVRRFHIGIRSNVVDEVLADFLDAILRIVHLRFSLAQNGLGHEGH